MVISGLPIKRIEKDEEVVPDKATGHFFIAIKRKSSMKHKGNLTGCLYASWNHLFILIVL